MRGAGLPSREPFWARRAVFVSLSAIFLFLLILVGLFSMTDQALRSPKPRNLRIITMGDSITWGGSGLHGNGYREGLYTRLHDDGFNIEFRGSQLQGNYFHEAFPGKNISTIQALGMRTLDGTIRAAHIRPTNLVLLHAGTNNLLSGETAAQMAQDLDRLLDELYRHRPQVCVVVAQIIGCACSIRVLGILEAYNNLILGEVVPKYRAQGKSIVAVLQPKVDMKDSKDGVHPGPKGYVQLAEAFYQGVREAVGKGLVEDPF